MPRLNVLIGANGSGKSSWRTEYPGVLPEYFYDADEMAMQMADEDYSLALNKARQLVSDAAERHLALGEDFGFESTYSGRSRPDIVRRAHELGYDVHASFIGTDDPRINIDRVAFRVNVEGGHDVENETIQNIWFRAQENLVKTAQYMSLINVYDNSDPNRPHRHMAEIASGRLVYTTDESEQWVLALLQGIRTGRFQRS